MAGWLELSAVRGSARRRIGRRLCMPYLAVVFAKVAGLLADVIRNDVWRLMDALQARTFVTRAL